MTFASKWPLPKQLMWPAGWYNKWVVVSARKAGNRFLGSLTGLQIRALESIGCRNDLELMKEWVTFCKDDLMSYALFILILFGFWQFQLLLYSKCTQNTATSGGQYSKLFFSVPAKAKSNLSQLNHSPLSGLTL